MNGIEIDGVTYSVPFVILDREIPMLYKYAERTESGHLKAEPIGAYYKFTVQMGQSLENTADYAALIAAITDKNNWKRSVTMPHGASGTVTFNAYFADVRDKIYKWKLDGTVLYRALTFRIIGTDPI